MYPRLLYTKGSQLQPQPYWSHRSSCQTIKNCPPARARISMPTPWDGAVLFVNKLNPKPSPAPAGSRCTSPRVSAFNWKVISKSSWGLNSFEALGPAARSSPESVMTPLDSDNCPPSGPTCHSRNVSPRVLVRKTGKAKVKINANKNAETSFFNIPLPCLANHRYYGSGY